MSLIYILNYEVIFLNYETVYGWRTDVFGSNDCTSQLSYAAKLLEHRGGQCGLHENTLVKTNEWTSVCGGFSILKIQ